MLSETGLKQLIQNQKERSVFLVDPEKRYTVLDFHYNYVLGLETALNE